MQRAGWGARAIGFGIFCVTAFVPVEVAGQSGGALPARPAVATAPAGHWEVGATGSLLVDYPSDEADPYCEQNSGGVGAHGSYWLRPNLGIEASLTATGGLGDDCPFALYAPMPPGEPWDRDRWDGEDFGTGTVATTVAVVAEPWRGSPVSPRARVGAGVMLGPPLGVWFYGGGIRYGFGRHSMTMDVERWNARIAVIRETVVVPVNGSLQVLSSRRVTSNYGMFLIRVGWAVAL